MERMSGGEGAGVRLSEGDIPPWALNGDDRRNRHAARRGRSGHRISGLERYRRVTLRAWRAVEGSKERSAHLYRALSIRPRARS
jgi:hypothetical protein